jgi:hypothetical protein
LTPAQRCQLALHALAGQPVSLLAQQHHVSRKFVYQQLHLAQDALEQAFAPAADDHEEVLFYLPVTRSWIRQFVLALVLICHSSLRGVVELLHDLFDYPCSLGTVANIVHQASDAAQLIDLDEDLSAIRHGALDEIFQGQKPVLVGADARSGYCFLLSAEEQRDGDTWAIRLLELRDRGFQPEATIADFATGLRKGHQQALPGVCCRGDVFHALHGFPALLTHLEARAYAAIATVDDLQRRGARFARRKGRQDRGIVNRTIAAGGAAEQAIALAEDVATLFAWLRQDILAVAGPPHRTRMMLYDWVVAELRARQDRCGRIAPIRQLLDNQRDALLAFAEELDSALRNLGDGLHLPVAVVREALRVQQRNLASPCEEPLRQQLGGQYAVLRGAVEKLASGVVRASSVIENVNSRLRNYFFLSKQLGADSLKLLKFFLNHRRLVRSAHAERVGSSPRELLSGQEHPHWLEMLGYQRFHRAA